MHRAGFEPAHPEIVGLKSTALDHSANDAYPTYGCRSQHRAKLTLGHLFYSLRRLCSYQAANQIETWCRW
jgi:hypothetical protein